MRSLSSLTRNLLGVSVISTLALAIAVGVAQPTARADVIKLRADNWCPYNCDPAADKPGFLIEIARAVFAAAGHQIDYKLMPWTRTLEEVRKGTFAGAVGASQADAPDLVYGSVPLAIADTAFAVKKGRAFRYSGPAALDGLKVAAIKDYSYDGGEIDAYLKANADKGDHIQFNAGDDAGPANLKKLMLGRVDIVVENPMVLAYAVRQLNLTDQIEIIPVGAPNDIFVAFSPADPKAKQWAELLSAGMTKLRQSGELATILARYGLTDWRGK